MNITDELRSCPLYKRLAPRKWLPRACFVLCMTGAAVCIAACAAEAYDKCFAPDAVSDWQVLAVIVLRTLMLVVPMVMGAFGIRWKARESNKRQEQQLAQLNAHQILALQEEIEAAEKLYGSFYLLHDYVYAPREKLLLRYDEIDSWSTAYNVNGFRTVALIRTADYSYYHIAIWKDTKYLKEFDSFTALLDSYRQHAKR